MGRNLTWPKNWFTQKVCLLRWIIRESTLLSFFFTKLSWLRRPRAIFWLTAASTFDVYNILWNECPAKQKDAHLFPPTIFDNSCNLKIEIERRQIIWSSNFQIWQNFSSLAKKQQVVRKINPCHVNNSSRRQKWPLPVFQIFLLQ